MSKGRRMCGRVLWIVGLLGLWAPLALGQSTLFVAVDTNWPEAVVFADSIRLGPAAQAGFRVPASTQQIRLVAEEDAWSVTPLVVELDAAPGDSLSLQMDFPYHYHIESVPFGADVYVETSTGRRKVGQTPLLHREAVPLQGTLLVEKAGFAVERFSPGQDVWNRHALLLQPSEQAHQQAQEVAWRPPSVRLKWLDYAALGLAVSAGVLSVHYKFKADRLYEEYERTTDPALRPRIKAYDTRAGVALGAMQLGVGVFAVRLILR